MPANPLEQAVASALTANNHMGTLFARIGNTEHPRGLVPTAYRNSRRAMRSALAEREPAFAASEVMGELHDTVRVGMTEILTNAQNFGLKYAGRQLQIYDLPETRPNELTDDLRNQLQSGIESTLAVIEKQQQAIVSVLRVGLDQDLVMGDEERVGILGVGELLADATFWTAALLWAAFELAVLNAYQSDTKRIGKLAVAALDSRTTDCCLRVHGQTQSIDKPFHLTGTPRYADRLDWSPFHRYCRTSIALYIADYDDGVTQDMRDAANSVLARR